MTVYLDNPDTDYSYWKWQIPIVLILIAKTEIGMHFSHAYSAIIYQHPTSVADHKPIVLQCVTYYNGMRACPFRIWWKM